MYSTQLDLGKHCQEAFIEFTIVIEDSFAKLLRIPGNRRVIRVVVVTATKDLVAVARWIEEVDCLAMG